MWLSKQTTHRAGQRITAPLCGTVTLSGPETAAYTDAERRGLAVCAPGGFFWRPSVRDEVLVIKEGGRGYVVAALPKEKPELEPGEILLKAGLSGLSLKPDGQVVISGKKVTVGGTVIYDEDQED